MHRNADLGIGRLRRKRRSIVQRTRRRQLMAAAGVLAFALGTATSIASFTGTDLAGAATARARSLMDMIEQRSPGARTEAQLTKTKGRHEVLAERSPEPVVHIPANLAEIIAPPLPDVVPVDLGPPPQLQFLNLPFQAPLFAVPPEGGPKAPPGGGGGGACCGGGGIVPPDAPTPPVTPAVPEPGTWMTMLVGFVALGWCLRRDRRAVAEAA